MLTPGSPFLGFDFGLAGTVTAMPYFQRAMGVPYESEPSGYLIPANVYPLINTHPNPDHTN